ncbi:lipopolysaccharide biosynthesis protein [Alteromonas sp. ASW11-19]|uniref:Lipopolysaccharide biosynthesis protein n=1 Tax=Alteromonas salexigens TaxID=2982530 RepID=A0ABT2VQP2_9ALTE|nr:lipopolysaccharide biosynthesis protein [Alteromonas salexigens]MCU7555625.1 lipopolysaccharide biosynthesis protein [Alteromonas salexigens]
MTNSAGDVSQKTKQSVMWYSTLPFATHMIRFLNSLLLARILAPEDFGIIGIITVILYYSDTFTDFGFAKAIINREQAPRAVFDTYFAFNLFVSLTILVIFQLNASNIASYFDIPELEAAVQVFTLMVVITAVSAPMKVKMRRELNFKALALIEAFKVAVSISFSLTLALNGYGFWALITAMLVAQTATLIPLSVVTRYVPLPVFSWSLMRDLFRFGKWDFLSGQLQLVANNIDKLIIGKSLGAAQVGFYDKAMGLAKMPHDQISIKIANIAFSTFSRTRQNADELMYYFRRLTATNAVIICPLLAGFAAVAEPFVMLILGDKWAPMITSLVLLCASFAISALANPVESINIASGKIALQTALSLVLTSGLVVSMLAVVSEGIEAVATVVLIFHIARVVFASMLLCFHLRLPLITIVAPLWLPVLASFVMLVTLKVADATALAEHSDLLRLAILIPAGGIIYLTLVWIIPSQDCEFIKRKTVNKLRKLFRKQGPTHV